MNHEPSAGRRRFLKHASLLVAGTQASALRASAFAGAIPDATQQAKPLPTTKGSDAVVDTSSGKVRGMVEDGIRVFKGIPYGASPAGTKRFMPPKKPAPWGGVRESTAFGHDAPQVPLGSNYDYSRIIDWLRFPGGQGEDCLVLNVWTPAVKDNAKRPVLVSFHGGGFTSGTGANILYTGHPLARFGDVVVVTLNHRLGCLGYLSMADIGAPPEFAQAGVVGMLDCVLALEWVRDNIANFGGDPGNVMVFGQSGGGAKVSHLLAMPSARGLFHKAAIQSGSTLRAATREAAARAGEHLLAEIGLTKKRATELQQVPVAMLMSAQATLAAQDPPFDFSPSVDESIIPRHPFDPDAPAISADVPLIVGTTLDDYSWWSTDFDLDDGGLRKEVATMAPGRSDAIVAAYRSAFPGASPFLLLGKMVTDHARRRDAYTLADRKAALRHASVHMYILEFPSPAYDGRFGAVHATDVPLVFHHTDGLAITGAGPDSRRMADQMAGAWVAFAKSGNPSHRGIPDWPAYTTDTRQTMIFNSTSRVANDPWAELRAMWSDA
jgi:para-nitrobenzyl esterase